MKTAIIVILLISFVSYGQIFPQTNTKKDKLSAAAACLFKDVKSKLTIAEKNELVQKIKLTFSNSLGKFILKDDPESSYYVDVFPVDMNKDGVEEVFITEWSSFFGSSGGQFVLFIKDKMGMYKSAINVLGVPKILSTGNAGYPDLLVGGPGMELPVWRYNGKAYAFQRTVKDDGKIVATDVSESCETYRQSLK